MDVVSGCIATSDVGIAEGRKRWFAQPEFWLLILLAIAAHFTRLSDLTIRGEESRRAHVAYEMLESGDWIVPRQQGLPYYSRPPLGSWLIAISAVAWGSFDALSIRFPSSVATLLTSLLIYGYARRFLTPLGALAAGSAFLTMVQVQELGRMAETEATLTMLVAASLLLWHWGYARKWSPGLTWSIGYGFAALAGLAKGLQGPVYFVAVTIIFLMLRRDWRFLLSTSHALGVLVFALVIGLWQVPYVLETQWAAVPLIWGQNATIRYGHSGFFPLAMHMLTYPLEVGCSMLPWSILPVAFLHPGFRKSLGAARPYVVFLAVALLATFPSCWFAIEARTRYFMPLYPCVAVLVGLVIDRSVATTRETGWTGHWYRFVGLFGLGAAAGGVLVCAASVFGFGGRSVLAQPVAFAVVYLIISCLVAGSLLWLRREPRYWRHCVSIVVMTGFLALDYGGLRINELVRKSVPSAAEVQQVIAALPEEARLVSLGKVHHLFAYYYGRTIPMISWPPVTGPAPDFEYFCVDKNEGRPFNLPFSWEQIAAVNCDRRMTERPGMQVIVGRRLREAEIVGQREQPDNRQ